MAEINEKVKISELPAATDLDGLVTIGTDGQSRSVKVPIVGVTKPPIIGNDGYWYVWSLQGGAYVRTNSVAIGKSAYQQAVEGGYQGTEQEFMNVLAHPVKEPIWLTQEEFDALDPKDPTQSYITYEEDV